MSVLPCLPAWEANMSKVNGEKARAAIQRRNRTARRVKDRAAEAAAQSARAENQQSTDAQKKD